MLVVNIPPVFFSNGPRVSFFQSFYFQSFSRILFPLISLEPTKSRWALPLQTSLKITYKFLFCSLSALPPLVLSVCNRTQLQTLCLADLVPDRPSWISAQTFLHLEVVLPDMAASLSSFVLSSCPPWNPTCRSLDKPKSAFLKLRVCALYLPSSLFTESLTSIFSVYFLGYLKIIYFFLYEKFCPLFQLDCVVCGTVLTYCCLHWSFLSPWPMSYWPALFPSTLKNSTHLRCSFTPFFFPRLSFWRASICPLKHCSQESYSMHIPALL